MTEQLCHYCGKRPGKITSGIPECQICWNWRKLGRPAAQYWVAAIERLFHDPETGGSGPDLIDWKTWEKWGMAESVNDALDTLSAISQAYEAEMEWHSADRTGC